MQMATMQFKLPLQHNHHYYYLSLFVGLALLGSLCSVRFAPSIAADSGLQTSFKLSHEIAHK
jgi:hypothetical protein